MTLPMSPIGVIKRRAGLQPLDSHQPANKSHLLATVSVQRQDTFPWHTATRRAAPLPRAAPRTEVGYGVWPADRKHRESRGPRRGELQPWLWASGTWVSAAVSSCGGVTRARAPFSTWRPLCRSGWHPSRPAWRPPGCSGGLSWTWMPSWLWRELGQLEGLGSAGRAGADGRGLPALRGPTHVQTSQHPGNS